MAFVEHFLRAAATRLWYVLKMSSSLRFEWPTIALLLGCYLGWSLAVFALPVSLGVPLAAVAISLQASLQHEVIHGHPTRMRALDEALVWPALGVLIPYSRFRDTHLAHHQDSCLTDPYEDPESKYLANDVWAGLHDWQQRLLLANNTLLGRVILGPLIGQIAFMRTDWALFQGGDRHLARDWMWHCVSVACVLVVVAWAGMPIWAYLLAAYFGQGIIKIRTFLEHQAHDRASNRTVIVEDRGPLAFLFLNNNLHAVHHRHPNVPWYQLPQVFARNKQRYLRCNGGYAYESYAEVIRAYLLRRKDPVAHPLWQRDDDMR